MNLTDEKREKDIQLVCDAVLNSSIGSTGDYGPGGMCPFCGALCSWDAHISKIKHDSDCIYLVAKDLKTNL